MYLEEGGKRYRSQRFLESTIHITGHSHFFVQVQCYKEKTWRAILQYVTRN